MISNNIKAKSQKVTLIKTDNFLKNKKTTYLKADIGGFEL